MPIKCNNVELLLDFIQKKHIDAKISHPSGSQTKIDFPDGLVMNIFTNKTINFQGKSYENHVASDIINVIEAINRD